MFANAARCVWTKASFYLLFRLVKGIETACLEPSYILYFFDFLEVAADGLDVLCIVDAEFDFGSEQAVAGVDVYAVDVHIELLREDACDLMEDAYAVEADDVECGWEGESAVSVPSGSQDLVSASSFESLRHFTLAFMYNNVSVFGEVSEHIIAGNRVTLIAQSVAVDGLFA